MDERKVTNHWHFGDLGANAVMLFMLVGLALMAVVAFAMRGNVVAIAILAVLFAAVLIVLGVVVTLVIMSRVHRHQEQMARVERVRELDDTREMLAVMKMTADALRAQQQGQTESWRTVKGEIDTIRKLASAGNGGEMVPGGFDFSDVDFAELED